MWVPWHELSGENPLLRQLRKTFPPAAVFFDWIPQPSRVRLSCRSQTALPQNDMARLAENDATSLGNAHLKLLKNSTKLRRSCFVSTWRNSSGIADNPFS